MGEEDASMAPQHQLCVCVRSLLIITAAVLLCCCHVDSVSVRVTGRDAVAVAPDRAKQFLRAVVRNRPVRPRRNAVWDRSRPDVQQWIMQFMHMGYDEARLETDLSYWMDRSRSGDQGRQHHYDENAPIGPRDAANYRHGANVNYDYY